MPMFPAAPRLALMMWSQSHAPVFSAQAAAIGLTPQQADDFAAASAAAEQAQQHYYNLRQQMNVARRQADERAAELRRRAGESVRSIRAFAEVQPLPSEVYHRASLPAPAGRTPMPAPAQPHALSARLESNDGHVTLRWRCAHPRAAGGTSYIVRRQLPGEPEARVIGVTGRKQFSDESLPPGPWVGPTGPSTRVCYSVQAQRGRLTGPVSHALLVQLGPPPKAVVTPAAVVTTKATETPKATARPHSATARPQAATFT